MRSCDRNAGRQSFSQRSRVGPQLFSLYGRTKMNWPNFDPVTAMVPIGETVKLGEIYSCSRSLFSFVNRSLNQIELRANIERIEYRALNELNDIVIFRVMHR
jgi:hypothetical protein